MVYNERWWFLVSSHRYNFRVEDDLNDKLNHFSEKENLSINEFLTRAVNFYINYKLCDYKLAPLEVQRYDQLLASHKALMSLLEKLIDRVDITSKMTVSVLQSAISGMVGDEVVFNIRGVLDE